jgi:RNA polymerase sigma factor (sigma-70 family)
MYSTISDKNSRDPLDIIIENEQESNTHNDISFILNSSILSDKQKDQIYKYYFENMSLAEIGKYYGVTREAIRQSIKRAIGLIRALA